MLEALVGRRPRRTAPADCNVGCGWQIRVVNAFRQGLDSRGSLADAALAEALRKQTALSKRFSHSSSIEYADAARDTLAPHDIDVERLSSHSHTETAV